MKKGFIETLRINTVSSIPPYDTDHQDEYCSISVGHINSKYGILKEDGTEFLPFEYDNITIWGFGLLQLSLNGKLGLLHIKQESKGAEFYIAKQIACEYDVIDGRHEGVVFFRKYGLPTEFFHGRSVRAYLTKPEIFTDDYAIADIMSTEYKRGLLSLCGADHQIITDEEYLQSGSDAEMVVLVGNDAVNSAVAELYLNEEICGFGIRYCTDDYCIRGLDNGGKKLLILAGGRPRSTIYAVYRYFECFCNCHWFWDGERLSTCELPIKDVELLESPRFEYRGIRYFAHRSLHRFQAEHWSLDDWQAELDWMLKKRLNLFMLRIGMDDLFQKAFPEIVPYPERDEPLPEAGEGYDNRSLFWSLEYRGELRKKILKYAFERDLIHPEDCGTVSHS